MYQIWTTGKGIREGYPEYLVTEYQSRELAEDMAEECATYTGFIYEIWQSDTSSR